MDRGRRPRPEAAQEGNRLFRRPAALKALADAVAGLDRADRRGDPVRIATFNINGVNRRLDHLLGWLAASEPDIVCLQELKVAEPDFPRGCDRSRWLRRGLAQPVGLERGRDPGAGCRAGADAHRSSGRPIRPPAPLHRGGGPRGSRRLDLRPERQSAARPEVRLQARLAGAIACARSRTARLRGAGGARRRLQRGARGGGRLSDLVLRRQRPGPAQVPGGLPAAASTRAGSMRFVAATPAGRSTRSGTIAGSAGSATPVCVSTTCCSAATWRGV